MSRLWLSTLIFATAISSPAGALAQTSHDKWVEAKTLDPDSAASDAMKDFAQKRCRLYSTLGAAGWMVIRSDMSLDQARKRYEIIYVHGTSDHITPNGLNGMRYAQIYNPQAVKNCGAVK